MNTVTLNKQTAGFSQAIALILSACALFFILGLDQGQLLSVIQGDVAYAQNIVHEATHDMRHTAAMPCN